MGFSFLAFNMFTQGNYHQRSGSHFVVVKENGWQDENGWEEGFKQPGFLLWIIISYNGELFNSGVPFFLNIMLFIIYHWDCLLLLCLFFDTGINYVPLDDLELTT